MAKKKKITPKQERFAQAFVESCNKRQAAITAGYSEKSAHTLADRLFKNVDVRTRIEQLQAERSMKTLVTADRVLEELARIGFFNANSALQKFKDGSIDVTKFTQDEAAAVAEITVDEYTEKPTDERIKRTKIKFHDKKPALDLMARHLGMLNDKLHVTGKLDMSDVLEKAKERLVDVSPEFRKEQDRLNKLGSATALH